MEAYIPSPNKEYQLCFANNDKNYTKTYKFYVDVVTDIFNNKFSFCIYIDNFLKTDDIRDSYEINLLDPEGNPKDFTIKNFDPVSIYAMMFYVSLEGIYTVKISEKSNKTEASFFYFTISQYEIDCKNNGNYTMGKEVKVQIPLTTNFFQENGSTDFHVSVVDSDGKFNL
ncbi:hypothetical protein MXB_2330 [Myxobolus squamalis]|nr:hypothetical protein MXB_2330 [Myxobolus squamalis]